MLSKCEKVQASRKLSIEFAFLDINATELWH